MILETIRDARDVKKLNPDQLPLLCEELRQFLVDAVSKTGGHIASNLGVVELTVAIHRVFDTASDRLVFDVGHQCYVHKALTGRRELFSTLRQFGGLSGFPKPYESEHDAFVAGHSSNSVSVALGMARARTLQRQDYSVLALLGDGALTGGLAYEGLNDAGASGEPMIVILNDNGMSINSNVGAVPRHLAGLRSRPAYYHFKKWYRGLFGENPMDNALYRFNHRVKTSIKKLFWPTSTLFEEMGFAYLGPIDGHDIERLCNVLEWAREMRQPVVVHVHTVKGRGVSYTEREPDRFHGVGPFDAATGEPLSAVGRSFSDVFGDELTALADEDRRICAVTAAMGDGTGLSPFAEAHPDRFFDVAIAEGHAAAMAAGMAKQGMIPVFAVYSTFLQRSYDMLIHDVALQRLHVVFGVDRAGLVGADGETHHGCFDAEFLSAIPGFTVLCPASFSELRSMLRQTVLEETGPVAIRYPRGEEGRYRGDSSAEAFAVLREGSDAALLTYGTLVNELLDAADLLAADGIETSVIKLNRTTNIPVDALAERLGKAPCLLILEDCFDTGCVGRQVVSLLAQRSAVPKTVIYQNLGETFAPAGTVAELRKSFGLDASGVAKAVREALRHGQ